MFWRATGHVLECVGTIDRPNRDQETYRRYESRTIRKSILWSGAGQDAGWSGTSALDAALFAFLVASKLPADIDAATVSAGSRRGGRGSTASLERESTRSRKVSVGNDPLTRSPWCEKNRRLLGACERLRKLLSTMAAAGATTIPFGIPLGFESG